MGSISISDGRVISAVGETKFIIPLILDWAKQSEIAKEFKLKILIPKVREMYDIMITSGNDESIIIPCNIKISNFLHTDNLSCQNVLDLISSGNIPENIAKTKDAVYKNVMKIKKKKLYNEPIDYYFICINKLDMGKSYHTSLLTIKDFNINASNLIQCNWGNNFKKGRTSLYKLNETDINDDKSRNFPERIFRSYEESVLCVIDSYNKCYLLREKQTKTAKKILKKQFENAIHSKEKVYDRDKSK